MSEKTIEKTPATGGALDSTQGRTTIADTVVSKIAGIATREVTGVHSLGGGAARAVGAAVERAAPVHGDVEGSGELAGDERLRGMSSPGADRSSSKRANQLGSSSSLILPARSRAAADGSSAAAARRGYGVGVPPGRI